MTILEYPLINPLKIFPQHEFPGAVPSGVSQPAFNANYNSTPFDSDWYANRIKSWEFEVNYFQKFQKGDSIVLQWQSEATSTNTDFEVYVLDCEGKEAKGALTPTVTIVAGYNYFSIEIPLWDLPEGYYFVQIRYDSKDYFISEPIDLKEVHKDTLAIKYWNSYNDHNILFEQTQIRFILRVNGYVSEMQPDSKREVYEDQPLNLVLLSGRPYRQWTLAIGDDGHGVSEYMAGKVSRAFDCDNTKLDTGFYTALGDSKLEPNRIAGYPLPSWKMTIRDRYNNDSIYVSDLGYYNLGLLPTSDRFYVRAFQYTIPASPTPVTMDIVFNQDFTGARNFADFLNNSKDLFSANGFDTEGYFSINESGELIYTYDNQAEKDYWLNGTPNPTLDGILPYWHSIEHKVNYPDTGFVIDIFIIGAGNNACIWGDGTQTNYNTSSTSLSHTYPNPTIGQSIIYKVFYYYDTQTELSFKSGGDYTIISLGGQVSPTLISLSSTAELISEIKDNLFTFANGAFTELYLNDNKLPVSQINNIIMMLQEANRNKKLGSGILAVNLQSPLAPPSGGSISGVAQELSQTFTLITD